MRILKVVTVLLTLAALLAACVAPQAPATTGGEPTAVAAEEGGGEAPTGGAIKIAFMGPLTGGAAFIGQEQLGFAKAAVQIFNEESGLNVELVEGDDEMNPDTGKTVAERFAADSEILVVIGPAGSQICESTQPIFAEAGLAHITPSCTRTDLTQPGTPTFFRPIPTDADQSVTDGAYMVDELGVQSAYLLDDQSSYSVGLNDELEAVLTERGVTAIERSSVTQDETDFSSLVTTIVAANPDVVFFPSQIENQMATLSIQLREQGYEGIFFLPDGGFGLGWVGTAGAAAEGTYVSFFSPDPNLVPEAQPYNEIYTAATGNEFGAFGGASAFTTYIGLQAIKVCADGGDLSRACVVDALTNINLESSPLGLPVAFGEGNQIAGSRFFLFQVKDGKFTLVQ